MFPAQVIATGELDKKNHKWLGALSGQLQRGNILELLDSRNSMIHKSDLQLADSILEECIWANRQVIDELMDDDSMYEVLMDIMEPQIKSREEQLRKEIQEEVRKEDLQKTINALRAFGHKNSEIKSSIIKEYKLSENEADEYL